eukprot:m.251930 g.251930  ORF g.251930 m.251930 type:complete len:54 (+) comp40339_c0_seq61:151-312(+)
MAVKLCGAVLLRKVIDGSRLAVRIRDTDEWHEMHFFHPPGNKIYVFEIDGRKK